MWETLPNHAMWNFVIFQLDVHFGIANANQCDMKSITQSRHMTFQNLPGRPPDVRRTFAGRPVESIFLWKSSNNYCRMAFLSVCTPNVDYNLYFDLRTPISVIWKALPNHAMWLLMIRLDVRRTSGQRTANQNLKIGGKK